MFHKNVPFDEKTIFLKSKEFVHRINPDKSAILVKISEEDEFYKIQGIASVIWQSIDGEVTIGEILKNILNEYDVTKEQLIKDSEPFLKTLIELKIVTVT
jgi:hypothetical protein